MEITSAKYVSSFIQFDIPRSWKKRVSNVVCSQTFSKQRFSLGIKLKDHIFILLLNEIKRVWKRWNIILLYRVRLFIFLRWMTLIRLIVSNLDNHISDFSSIGWYCTLLCGGSLIFVKPGCRYAGPHIKSKIFCV